LIRTTAGRAIARRRNGADHPDRDAQFRHIKACVKKSLAAGLPVISMGTKKKELVGNYDNAGQQWLPAKQPVPVSGHDFPSPEVPRAFPYGVHDLGRNAGTGRLSAGSRGRGWGAKVTLVRHEIVAGRALDILWGWGIMSTVNEQIVCRTD
jgi:hypothetical protein